MSQSSWAELRPPCPRCGGTSATGCSRNCELRHVLAARERADDAWFQAHPDASVYERPTANAEHLAAFLHDGRMLAERQRLEAWRYVDSKGPQIGWLIGDAD